MCLILVWLRPKGNYASLRDTAVRYANLTGRA